MSTDEPYFACPDCNNRIYFSDEDPDAAFGDMLSHIRWVHPETDQDPAALWPRIQVVGR